MIHPEPIKIAITGPESTGKTQLALYLSKELGYAYVAEVARELMEKGRKINQSNDLVQMAHQQIKAENKYSQNGSIICDTDLTVLYVWCKDKYHHVPLALQSLMAHHRYSITLLCAPDIPWEPDPLRVNPYDRERLFDLYKSVLESHQVQYSIIHGSGPSRMLLAKKQIELNIGRNKK